MAEQIAGGLKICLNDDTIGCVIRLNDGREGGFRLCLQDAEHVAERIVQAVRSAEARRTVITVHERDS